MDLYFLSLKLLKFENIIPSSSIFSMIKCNLVAFVIVFLTSTAFSQNCTDYIRLRNGNIMKDVLCPEVMVSDLQFLREKLEEIHPDPYYYISKNEFDSIYKISLLKASKELTILEFSVVVSDFLNAIKDSHTSINPMSLFYMSTNSRATFPFELVEINDKFYFQEILQKKNFIGYEVLEINGMNILELFNQSFHFSLSEADASEARREIAVKGMGLIFNLSNAFVNGDSIPVKLVDYSDTIVAFFPCSSKRDFVSFKGNEKPASLRYYFDTNNRGILIIPTFEPKSLKRFKKELDDFFQLVSINNCTNIIIDLRNNQGGLVRAQEYLLSYLNYKRQNHEIEYLYKRSDYDRFSLLPFYQKWQFERQAKRVFPKGVISKEYEFFKSKKGTVKRINYDYLPKNNRNSTYNEQCTLLINGFSMSASVLFTSWFKSMNRGEIIGSPCLGTMSGTFGNGVQINLKETGLPVSISTLKFNPLHTKEKYLEAIQPTVKIKYSLKDLSLNSDPVFKYLNIVAP